jgi:hypothetical protein
MTPQQPPQPGVGGAQEVGGDQLAITPRQPLQRGKASALDDLPSATCAGATAAASVQRHQQPSTPTERRRHRTSRRAVTTARVPDDWSMDASCRPVTSRDAAPRTTADRADRRIRRPSRPTPPAIATWTSAQRRVAHRTPLACPAPPTLITSGRRDHAEARRHHDATRLTPRAAVAIMHAMATLRSRAVREPLAVNLLARPCPSGTPGTPQRWRGARAREARPRLVERPSARPRSITSQARPRW